MAHSPEALDAVVKELGACLARAGLGPADQVRVLAGLLSEVGWRLAAPGLSGEPAALAGRVHAEGDLPSALILQGHILRAWLEEGELDPAPGRPAPD